jgi:hypothetical protein
MNQHINLAAFGTFGNPNGFKQSFFAGNQELVRSVKTFDLKTDAIKLFPQSKIYSIRKEFVSGNNAISYSIYTFAKEPNSDRGGTFIGSSLLFTNRISDEAITIVVLNEFHNKLVKNNVQNDVIAVSHSDSFKAVSKPKDFDRMENYLKQIVDLDFIQSSNKNLVVYSEVNPNRLQQLFSQALDLLNIYDTIYFTDSKEVAEFVIQKGIFRFVQRDGFEQELKNWQDEKKQKLQTSIDEFERERQKLDENRNILIEGYKKQIEINKRLHQENKKKIDDSENEVNILNQKYNNYAKKIGDSISQLRSGKSVSEVRQFHHENKRIFIDSISIHQGLPYIGNVSIANVKSDLGGMNNAQDYREGSFEYENRKRGRIDLYKIASLVLLLLLLGTIVYFFYFGDREEINLAEVQTVQNQMPITPPPVPLQASVQELAPKQTDELSEKDYKKVAVDLTSQMSIDAVIQIIFAKNPKDVGNTYSNQPDAYSKKIIELNRNCFAEVNGKYFYVSDTIRHIPSYRKN